MGHQAGQVVARVGPILLVATGASPAVIGGATLLIATGGVVALALAGYGLFRRLSVGGEQNGVKWSGEPVVPRLPDLK